MKKTVEQTQRILTVDDDNFVRTLFGDALEKAGYETTLAFDGDSALRCLKKQPHDLILLDLVMPGMVGSATCAEMRKVAGLRSTGSPSLSRTPR